MAESLKMSSTPCALRRVRRMLPLSWPAYSTSTSCPCSFSMTMVVAGSPGPQHTAANLLCSTTVDSSPVCTCRHMTQRQKLLVDGFPQEEGPQI